MDGIPEFVNIESVEGFEDYKISIDVDLGTMDESIWYGGKYNFILEIDPVKYPINAPKVICTTPIWHPNINEEGLVDIDNLKRASVGGDWRPEMKTSTFILGLINLFREPNPNDPMNQIASA